MPESKSLLIYNRVYVEFCRKYILAPGVMIHESNVKYNYYLKFARKDNWHALCDRGRLMYMLSGTGHRVRLEVG